MANEVIQIPDLYQLLGLEPLQADRARIEAALKQLIARAHAVKATDPKQAQRLAKIVELGKRNLLSAERKVAYDAQWKRCYQAEEQLTGNREAWDTRELDPLLPSGDPQAAFDLGGFLDVAASLPETDYEADFLKLQSLLSGEPLTSPTPAATSSQHASAMSTLHTAASPPPGSAGSPIPGQARESRPASGSPSSSPRSNKSLAKQLRAKRDRSLLSIVAGVLLSLGVVLAFLFWQMNSTAVDPQTTTAAATNNPGAPNELTQPGVPPAPAPRRSGLPQVQGLEGGLTVDDIFGGSTPSNATPSAMIPAGEPAAPEPVDGNPALDPVELPKDPATPSGAPMVMQEDPGNMQPEPPTMQLPTAEPVPSEPPAAEPMLSDEEKQAWGELMRGIRQSLGQQEFAQATTRLSQAAELAKTSPQKAQLARQQAVAKLAEEFHAALVEAILNLGAGETFKVKSTDVSFVEGSESRIVIRLQGKNESYDLVDLPVFLAFGLADLRLDSLHSSSLARKAAFALVHPKTNEFSLAQARAMMDQAVADEVVASDLAKAFDDDFQL